MPTTKTTKTKKAPSKKVAAKEKIAKAAAVEKTKAEKVAPIKREFHTKKEVIETYKTHEGDTGSVQVQVAVLTERIAYLTEHLKLHPKDNNSRRGLLGLVSKRRKLLTYLKRKSKDKYEQIVTALDIRG